MTRRLPHVALFLLFLLLPTLGTPGPTASVASAKEDVLDEYARLLARWVVPAGVRYGAWRADRADVEALSRVVARLSAADPDRIPAQERNALLINLYNAKILEIVLEERPVESIREVTPGLTGFGVFSKPSLVLAGRKVSLQDVEDRLREQSGDPRVHFAINCASRSCPPIAPEPYRAQRLDEQLERATRAFLSSPEAIELERGRRLTVRVSKIFDWYEKDFEASGGTLSFLERYAPRAVGSALREARGRVKIDYQDYDWSLNAAP